MFNKPYAEALDKRLQAKADGNKIIDTTYKLLLNSLFGQFNNEYSHFYDPHLANRILMNGQLMLLMLIEELDLIGCEIISANTDSVDIIFRKEMLHTVNEVCDKWSEMTNGITVDADRVKQCIFRDINAYFMELELPDGSSYIKEKGAWTTNPRIGKGFDKPIVYKALREYFINQTSVDFCGCMK